MNKKLIKSITDNLPIIGCVILILTYLYLCIPEDYTIQLGGADPDAVPLPKNTPFIFTYRWLFVAIPILIIIHLIYSIYYFYTIKSLTTWDLARDFFKNYQAQTVVAISPSVGLNPIVDGYRMDGSGIDPVQQPELYKYVNFTQLAGNPRSGIYHYAQYFCNAYRPCSCCHDANYRAYFSNGTINPTSGSLALGKANPEFMKRCNDISKGIDSPSPPSKSK